MNRLLHCFFDIHMGLGHDGLRDIAGKKKLKVHDLKPGEMLLFINKKMDKIKILAGANEVNSRGIIGYYRSPRGRIDISSLQYIADAFSGGSIDYDKALRKTLMKKFEKTEVRIPLLMTKKKPTNTEHTLL